MVKDDKKATKKTIGGKLRIRSPDYPRFSLEESIGFVKIIDRLGGRANIATVQAELKIKNPNTPSFTGKISSARQFGLIERKGELLAISDMGQSILYPTDEIEENTLKSRALGSPPLYKRLLDRYRNKKLPDKNMLANVLMNELRLSREGKDRAAKKFLDSAAYVGALTSDGLLKFVDASGEGVAESLFFPQPKPVPSEQPSVTASQQSARITLTHGDAELKVPGELTEEDADRLKRLVELFVKAKTEEET